MERIAVIVVNYGTADLAIAAVQSVLSQTHGGRHVAVHLVDNASPGADADVLRQTHAKRGWAEAVTLWLETENHGFGRGNNVVLNALASQTPLPDYVFLLNPDARLENDTISILAESLNAAPQAAAAGACVVRPDMMPVPAAFRFPGAVSEIARTINLGLLDRVVQSYRVSLSPDIAEGAVGWVSGASVMFRFEALQQVGFFDPEFFLYYEEVDLMRRLTETGWQILYVPRARVVHEEGAATQQFAGKVGRQRDPVYLYESWRHYFTRAFGRVGGLAIALAMIPAAFLNMLHRGVRGREASLPRHFITDHWQYVIRPLITARPKS